MSGVWKQYKPKLAIYDVLDKPGGISVDVAMKRAEQQLEALRGEAMGSLAKSVQQLDVAARGGGPANPTLIYALSTEVLDIAGIYHPALCRAANSLCDLVQRMQASGRWDWPSVAVHVSAMRLMSDRTEESDPAVQAVLKGLGSVVAKYPDPTPPDPPRQP